MKIGQIKYYSVLDRLDVSRDELPCLPPNLRFQLLKLDDSNICNPNYKIAGICTNSGNEEIFIDNEVWARYAISYYIILDDFRKFFKSHKFITNNGKDMTRFLHYDSILHDFQQYSLVYQVKKN